MSVHKKLMEARIELQGTQLKKSGLNKFAGYSYFELGDFLPTIQAIFNKIGLCGVVSYATDMATLTITDVEDGTCLIITSPMAEANLKGTHPIQNLGAVETYQRRYLWMTAMEIVEHDILDATTGYEEPAKAKPVKQEAPAKAEKASPPPAKIEGKEGPWQLKVEIEPEGGFIVWAEIVMEATKLALSQAGSEADVMAIFRVNKNIFDRLNAEPGSSAYSALLAEFSAARARFKKEEA
jgi:ERF superfamily